ncbi:hypothetical protein [Campylobacter vicugnae]|uniref:hypothetical protein n=1 Tax=Campylobacter vicugnae TaxID=1660076 RepID=UPI000A33EB52|nr:hypothetical protein [Campylobacter sp. RM8835]
MKSLIINFSLIFGFLTILAGCAFNPSNRGVLFLNGQSYYIPYGSTYIYMDSQRVASLESAGYDIYCSLGQVLWYDRSIDPNLITNDKLHDMFSQNLAGCSSPLGQAELNYIQHREMLQQQELNMYLEDSRERELNRNLQNLRNYNFLKLW